MNNRKLLAGVGRFAGVAALVELGIIIAVLLVCWLAGWNTIDQYGQALVWAGFLAKGVF
jgi:hypothetical protein